MSCSFVDYLLELVGFQFLGGLEQVGSHFEVTRVIELPPSREKPINRRATQRANLLHLGPMIALVDHALKPSAFLFRGRLVLPCC